MTDPLGCLCIVLHGHLPYVLHHGTNPHGEAWLYEAAAETYLPLLEVIGEVALHKARPAVTFGLTPVLLEQLSHERFKTGFVQYLNGRMDRARHDRREFEGKSDGHLALLAERWEKFYAARLAHFERIGRDIPAAYAQRFREGHVQILTSAATHALYSLAFVTHRRTKLIDGADSGGIPRACLKLAHAETSHENAKHPGP